jgi:ABC-type Fe3+-hydroxamate transport system substrate-binding protein
MLRVVSLVPSATETLLAWNVEPIGVTRFCEQGDRFPTFGGTKDPHLDAIVAMSPDVVVMCDQENRKEDAEALTAAGLRVHAIHITQVSHVGPEMTRLADALGLDRSLGESCNATNAGATDNAEESPIRLAGWKGRSGGTRSGAELGPARIGESGLGTSVDEYGLGTKRNEWTVSSPVAVFVPIWRKPWMTINNDTYGGSILEAAGFVNIFKAHTNRYPTVDPEEIVAKRPDVVLAPSEPYPFTERQRAELEVFAPVRFVDGKDLFWWGARTPAALARIRGLHNKLL